MVEIGRNKRYYVKWTNYFMGGMKMGKLFKKLVSVITTVVVVSVLVVTSLPAVEAKATTTTITESGAAIVPNSAENNVVTAKRKEGVYFKKPAGWGTPTCYVYDDSTSTIKKNASWPGIQMIDDGENGYYYKIPEGFTNPKVMFASGNKQFPGANQAGHVYTPGTALICDGISWKEEKITEGNPNPVVLTEGVYFKKPSDWGIPTCYVYDDSTSTVKKNASWPGVQMIYDGLNGYYYKIPEGFTNPKVMFASGNKQFPGANQAGHVYTPGTALICDGTSWREEKIVKPVPATVGISQEGGIFKTESLELTLSLLNASSATYSVNDGPAIAYTNGQKIIIGDDIRVNSNIIVKLRATGATGIVEKTYTFTKEEQIISDPLVMPTVQISPAGPHYVGLDINISLDKEFKTAYKYYKFEIGSQVISDFSEAKETNWTPFKSGTYVIKITGEDGKGNSATVTKNIIIESDDIMDYVDITSAGPSVTIKLKNVVITPELINQIKSSKYYAQIISSEEYSQFLLAVKAKLITISYSDMSITVNQVKIGNYFIPIPVFDEEGNLSKEFIPVVINYTVPK